MIVHPKELIFVVAVNARAQQHSVHAVHAPILAHLVNFAVVVNAKAQQHL